MGNANTENGGASLRDSILQGFARSPYRGALRKVTVEVQSGKVRLDGEVTSFYFRQHATAECRKVAGPREIENLIRVAKGSQ